MMRPLSRVGVLLQEGKAAATGPEVATGEGATNGGWLGRPKTKVPSFTEVEVATPGLRLPTTLVEKAWALATTSPSWTSAQATRSPRPCRRELAMAVA